MATQGNKYKVGDVVRVIGPAGSSRVGRVFVVTEAVPPSSRTPYAYVCGAGDFDGGIFESYLEPATVSTERTPAYSGAVGKVERNWQPRYYGAPDESKSGLYFHGRISPTASTADARDFAENILRIVNQIELDAMIKAATPTETEEQRKKRELQEQIKTLQSELDILKGQAKRL